MNWARITSWPIVVLFVVSGGLISYGDDATSEADAVFQRLDKNGDGKVSASEIPEDQARFFERLLRKAGKDANGELTREEFRSASAPDERPNVRVGADQGQGQDPKQRFAMLDRNKDGKLTLDEVPEPVRDRLKAIFERSGKQELTQDEFLRLMGEGNRPEPAEMFKRLDANSDGKLSKDELPAEMRDRMAPLFERLGKTELTLDEFSRAIATARDANANPRGERRPEMERPQTSGNPEAAARDSQRSTERRPDGAAEGRGPLLFRLLDTNHDGHVSKEEYAKIVDLFDQLDQNHDGQLDPFELIGVPPGAARRAGMPETSRDRDNGRDRQATRDETSGEPGPFFKRLDSDGDGKISKDEAPEMLKEKFGSVDTDGDGFISPDEFRAAARLLGEAQRSRQPERSERPRRE